MIIVGRMDCFSLTHREQIPSTNSDRSMSVYPCKDIDVEYKLLGQRWAVRPEVMGNTTE